jgi:hypothetical protein
MTKAEWLKVLEEQVEKAFDPSLVDGFENSAPEIKLGILADLYNSEPDCSVEMAKELAYRELADHYSTMIAWN